MRNWQNAAMAGMMGLAVSIWGSGQAEAGLIKKLDRPFPTGLFCPLESRASAGADLSFVAPASTIRVTFSGMNQDASGNWNGFHVDNVAVVLKSVFDAHQIGPTPNFETCYDPTIPPGHTSGGVPEAPSYDFNAASTPELSLDLFAANITGWTGQHAWFDSTRTAPTSPATGTGTTGGSLGLGLSTDGAVAVSASRLVTGLTVGQQYVITAWWDAQQPSPLDLIIGVPCADADADGFVICSSCDAQATETCGDCNDTNAHCTSNCADADADGWCVTTDCNDTVATCTSNCATDADADAVADCNQSNPWCNVSCVDADGDGHCAPGDCQDSNPNVANGLAEVNDYLDQNCPGDDGYGVADEVSGQSGFATLGSNNLYSWTAQTGAGSYLAVRSTSSLFPPGCASLTTPGTSWIDAASPAAGGIFYYLVRPLTTAKGSWGQRSNGVERAVVCGAEANCANGLDDDADTLADCADTDCGGTPPCRAQIFTFLDTTGNDIPDNGLQQFLQSATAGASDYLFFELQEPGRTVAWCSLNAGYYRTQYLSLAPTQGTVTSGSWNKWRKAPSTGNAWTGPDTTGHLNQFGNDCFGPYSWCSEQFSPEPQNSIFPDRINDCEAYDLATGACGASVGGTWRLTIKIASARLTACGF